MTVSGLKSLNKKLRAMPVAAKAELETAVVESAERVATLARGLAPVDSGDLRASVRVEAGRHELQRLVVAGGDLTTPPGAYDFDYALKAEIASPFFYPAFRALKRPIRARMARAYRNAAKKVGGNAE